MTAHAHTTSASQDSIRRPVRPPNGQRISGERRAEGDERVRCMRVLGRAELHREVIEHADIARKGNRHAIACRRGIPPLPELRLMPTVSISSPSDSEYFQVRQGAVTRNVAPIHT